MKHFSMSIQTINLIQKIFPIAGEHSGMKICHYATLSIFQNKHWAPHPRPVDISIGNYWKARLHLESGFKNHIVSYKEFTQKLFYKRQFQEYDVKVIVSLPSLLNCCLQDMYSHFTRILPKKTIPESQKDFKEYYIVVQDPQLLRNFQALILPLGGNPPQAIPSNFQAKFCNKTICFPASLSPTSISQSLEAFCLENRIRFMPMKNLEPSSLVSYILKNKRGNVLFNELPFAGFGDYLISQEVELRQKPQGLVLFCEHISQNSLISKQQYKNPFVELKTLLVRHFAHYKNQLLYFQKNYILHDKADTEEFDKNMYMLDLRPVQGYEKYYVDPDNPHQFSHTE